MTIDKRPRIVLTAASLLALAGCSTLPTSGPTGHEIYKASSGPKNTIGFRIVDVNDQATLPVGTGAQLPHLAPGRAQSTDLLGPGDVLQISVYEAGVSLFANSDTPLVSNVETGAKPRQIPPIRVDDDGYITFPYVGRIKVAGHTTTELQKLLEMALQSQSEKPQVLVTQQRSLTNSVVVYGEIGQSGRQVLATNHESLIDVIAMAGGYHGEATSLVARIERNGHSFQARLEDIQKDPAGVIIYPGDRISLLKQPQSFSVMGGAGHITQVAFSKSHLSLAEALSQAGGSDDGRGDPKAVFIFRFVTDQAGGDRPIIYHINMMTPQAFFLAQQFTMRDQDILYVGNAAANNWSKFVGILSQFFSPFVAARAVAN
jgi:polysaccharide export outer membrane protein